MINAGVDYILRHLDPRSRVRILNCLFIQSLTNLHAARAGGSYRPPKLSPIDKAISAGIVDTVYFPLHVTGNHWTLLHIDLVHHTIAFADSLSGSPPSEELALVRWWLKSFFLMAWRSHVESHPDYNVNTQFISRESYDIFLTICDSLLSLMLVYRKYFPTYPFLPWLHSTEVCEHIFGMLRQLKKDFTYGDILYLERKLQVLMMGAFKNLSPDQQENQASAGYMHTYFKADDLDLSALREFPSDEEFQKASAFAFDEATQLLRVVGIDALKMLAAYRPPAPVHLRPATSRPPQTIAQFLALYKPVAKTSKAEETAEACEMALAAEALDKSLAIAALPDSTDESLESLTLDLEAILAMPIKGAPIQSLADYAIPLTLGIHLNDLILVSERMRHQTKSTSKAVRQHGRLSTIMERRSKGTTESESGPSLREMLIQRLAVAVPAADTLNKTTGVDRYVRHAGTFGGSGAPSNVRAQNKATVKGVAAAKFGAARVKAFKNLQWIHENMHLANITELNPLKPCDYVIVLKPGNGRPEVLLGTVVSMYTKNTMHDWIPNAPHVGTPSYICVEAYRRFAGAMFSSIACERLSCPTVLQIPRTHLLFSLASYKITRQSLPTPEGYPHTMATLCAASLDVFNTMHMNAAAFQAAVRAIGQGLKDNNVGEDMMAGEDAELPENEEAA
ncbi:hypothetical protein R3P38DRAFT_2514522 [Favolaschia claudopus]|uniref:Ubiquitin-like protease family profile domain-containing protein n=1 Tax=Favolaschia claudopus TaxID=2862362 RepID=A0AAW0CQ19_9AGAR